MESETGAIALALVGGIPPTIVALAGLWKAMQIGGKSESYHEDALIKLNQAIDSVKVLAELVAAHRRDVLDNAKQVTQQLKETRQIVASARIISEVSMHLEKLIEYNEKKGD